jgi:hypothetical protein
VRMRAPSAFCVVRPDEVTPRWPYRGQKSLAPAARNNDR